MEPVGVHVGLCQPPVPDDDVVQTQPLYLAERLSASAFTDREHRDDGGHADDHAQHAQGGPQLVAPERFGAGL